MWFRIKLKTTAMQPFLETILGLREILKSHLPMKEEYQRRLDEKFRLEFGYNSNHIEGNTLTYNEVALAVIYGRGKGDHSLQEYDEVRGHDIAFAKVKELAAD